MTEYIVDAVLIILLYMVYSHSKIKMWKRNFIVTTSFILFFRMAFRALSIGSDIIRYNKRFLVYSYSDIDIFSGSIKEPLYVLFNKLCSLFGESAGFRILLIITSAFVILSVGNIFYRYSENLLLSYLTYLSLEFYAFQFSALRQAIAMAFICWAFHFCIQKKMFLFIIMVVLAAGFHITSIVFLPCYFIRYFKWNRRRILAAIIVGIVFINNISSFGNYILSTMGDDFEKFSSAGNVGSNSILIVCLLIVEILFNSPVKNRENKNIVLNNIMIIAFLIQVLSAVSYNFTRLNLYFFQFAPIYFANIFNKIDSCQNKIYFTKSSKKILFFTIVLILLFVYISQLTPNPYDIIPYKYMWKQ